MDAVNARTVRDIQYTATYLNFYREKFVIDACLWNHSISNIIKLKSWELSHYLDFSSSSILVIDKWLNGGTGRFCCKKEALSI